MCDVFGEANFIKKRHQTVYVTIVRFQAFITTVLLFI